MAEPLIWKSFDLHNFMFGYLYPTLIDMDPKEMLIIKHKFDRKLIPWLTFAVFGFSFIGILPIGYILFREMYFPSGYTSMSSLAIYIGVHVGNILPLGVCTLPLVNEEYVGAMNQIFMWAKKLQNDYPDLARKVATEEERKRDEIGLFLCTTVICIGCCPFGGTVIAVVFNTDQFYYLFEEILKPN
ncbi:unnamed protein product [Orchesella dallaii]|uniref:Uncharacterized protein n=1 Tax=Orchesella dallaii TaxID=48710 RepID=A0ABP1Q3B3_9HEXA